MLRQASIVTAFTPLAIPALHAAEGAIVIPAGKPFNLVGDLGYVVSETKREDGDKNSKQALTTNVLFQRMVGVWGQEAYASALTTHSKGRSGGFSYTGEGNERYLVGGKMIRSIDPATYVFGRAQWDKDLSTIFDYQVTGTVGLGRSLYRDARQSLRGEVGVGGQYSKYDYPNLSRKGKDHRNSAVGTLDLFYQYNLNKAVVFNQDLGFEYSSASNTLRSRTALSALLTNRVSAVASYGFKSVEAKDSQQNGRTRDGLLSVGLRYAY